MSRQYFSEGVVDLLFVRKLDAIKLTFEAGRFQRRQSLPPGTVIPVQ
jgi:hypothetical protein